MRKKTKEEILAKISTIWPLKDFSCDIGEDDVRINIAGMYSAPGLTFSQLKELSDFFDTDYISIDTFDSKGCETCNYGSYVVEIIVR